MRKIKLISGILLTFLFSLSAFADILGYKALAEHPPEEGSPVATFILFAQACEARDIESMKKHGGSTYNLMLDNSPTALDHLHGSYGNIDFERPFEYRIVEKEDYSITILLRYFRKGEEKRLHMGRPMSKKDDKWTVG